MTDATAKYIITAEDRTKSTIASVKEGFKTLDKTFRETTGSLRLMSELILGGRLLGGIKRLTESIITAGEKSDKGFAGAMDHVKESFANLLAPKGGLPEATEKMKELAETLQNPAVIAAADSLTGSLIRGFATAAKYTGEIIAGLGLIINGPAQASMRIDDRARALQDERKLLVQSAGGEDKVHFSPETVKRLQEIDAQLVASSAKYEAALKTEYAADLAAAAAAEALAAAKQRINDIKARGITLSYELKKSMDEVDAGGKFLEQFDQADKAAEKLTRTAVENQIQSWNDYFDALDLLRKHDVIDQKTYADRARDYMDENLQEVIVTVKHFVPPALKESTDQMSEYAKRAAQNIQDAFANFLFDPFHAGLKGMLVDFLNVIRRMVAEAAAAQILKSTGIGSFISSIVGSLFGGGGGAAPGTGNFVGPRAGGGPVMAGGAYLVGEQGPELFSPRSNGDIMPSGSFGGDRINIVINSPVDARGAQEGQAALVARAIAEGNERVKVDIIEGLRRRKYRI